MSEFLASNEWQWRLLRTIVQGVLGVVIANLDLIMGWCMLDPSMRGLVVALVMAVLSPIMAALGGDGDPQAGDDLYRALVTGRLDINEGMVVENAVAQALAANGHGLYFHEYSYRPAEAKRESSYEIDFLIVRGKRLCPIEVKSSGYKRHKSFDYFTEKYDVKVNERFIVYTKNLAREGNLTYLPLYMAMCL